jgi:hypothetical protein
VAQTVRGLKKLLRTAQADNRSPSALSAERPPFVENLYQGAPSVLPQRDTFELTAEKTAKLSFGSPTRDLESPTETRSSFFDDQRWMALF